MSSDSESTCNDVGTLERLAALLGDPECFVCVRPCGRASYALHVTKCAERWAQQDQLLSDPLQQHRPVFPSPQEVQDLDSKEAAKNLIREISQKNRYCCKGCQRRFGGERIEQHCNSCRLYQSNFFRDYQREQTERQLKRIDKMPDMPMCHVCGRNVCTESYEFHLSKCRDLWTYEDNLLPDEFQKSSLVELPSCTTSDNLISKRRLSVTQETARANSYQCKICGRYLLSFNIVKHTETCSKLRDKELMRKGTWLSEVRMTSSSRSRSAPPSSVHRKHKLLVCHICGRDCLTSSFELHQSQCRKKWHNLNDQMLDGLRKAALLEPPASVTSLSKEAQTVLGASIAKRNMWRCRFCFRIFAGVRIETHEKICSQKDKTIKTKDLEDILKSHLCDLCSSRQSEEDFEDHFKICHLSWLEETNEWIQKHAKTDDVIEVDDVINVDDVTESDS